MVQQKSFFKEKAWTRWDDIMWWAGEKVGNE